ncbi:hypothetical protein [Lysobacter niastensis]|uniref:Uncharacterized protein n=1 Tax=Lysobacter niastensis TaxID=380629 RepID=A0ABS0B5B2_9GAMM|nr:hypothetical protein [Lysobacter niastensis]MBF6024005.1 hypothetical protein [Lysobacter niastensis]
MALSFIANLFGRRLRVGDRVRLEGGYDMEPRWLNGQSAYFGLCVDFIPGDAGRPAAVVQLEKAITFDGAQGNFLVLRLRYVGARWAKREVVHLELFSSPPNSLQDPSTRGLWIESHASYRVEGPNNSFKPKPLRGSP